jgi:hyaluronate lyase
MNGDNGDGWYTGDGALYLYTPTGFDEYSPAWWAGADKTLIPGTTVEDRPREIMFFNCGWRPNRDFVGGVCLDGEFLTAGMDYESFHNERDEGRPDTGAGRSLPVYHCTLTAKKSWFFFDRAVLCMGCDVESHDGYRVRTVLEHRALSDDAFILADGLLINFSEGDQILFAQRIFIPHTGGIVFHRETELHLRFYENAGVRYASLWLDHGVDPKGEQYAYILLPIATEEATLAYDPSDLEILQNDGILQSARESSSGLCGMIFRDACEMRGVTADHGMIAMMREADGAITSLSVCDPTQRRECFSLSVSGQRFKITADDARGRAYRII